KTFCIPNGGGGPGMGPVGLPAHPVPVLPGHARLAVGRDVGPVSAPPWGSARLVPISAIDSKLPTRREATDDITSPNRSPTHLPERLADQYPVLYRGQNGGVAYECIVDARPLKGTAGVEVEDVAKRLMDYGFHAPTVSFPVAGTLMIEPTESEPKAELDRFC